MKLVESKQIKEHLFKRLEELGMTPADLIKDANERGMTITPSAFSKYKQGKKGGITDNQLLYLCCRLYIPIKLVIGEQKIIGGSIVNVVPKYSELEALKLVKRIYGKNG
jgi:hypothetical protein